MGLQINDLAANLIHSVRVDIGGVMREADDHPVVETEGVKCSRGLVKVQDRLIGRATPRDVKIIAEVLAPRDAFGTGLKCDKIREQVVVKLGGGESGGWRSREFAENTASSSAFSCKRDGDATIREQPFGQMAGKASVVVTNEGDPGMTGEVTERDRRGHDGKGEITPDDTKTEYVAGARGEATEVGAPPAGAGRRAQLRVGVAGEVLNDATLGPCSVTDESFPVAVA